MPFRHAIPALVLLAWAQIGAQENYDAWRYSRSLRVKAEGLGLSAPVVNFPLLVRLDGANFDFGAAARDGRDIRFTREDGITRLPHQIERWDSSAAVAEVWVLVDTVHQEGFTGFRFYFGNSDAADSSDGRAVFDTANGYMAVWHMNAPAGDEADATLNGFTLTAGNAPGRAAGAIGSARSFNGTDQYFVAESPATHDHPVTNIDATRAYTLSAWVLADSIQPAPFGGNSIVNKGNNQYALQVYGGLGSGATNKRWESAVYTTTWRQMPSRAATPARAHEWHLITGTWNGAGDSTARIYVDGVLDSAATMVIDTPVQIQDYDVFVGVNPNAGGTGNTAPNVPGGGFAKRWWWGLLDEVTIAGKARDPDWVKLAFATQRPGPGAVTLGEPIGGLRLGGPLVDAEGFQYAFESRIQYHQGFEVRGRTEDSARFAAGQYGADSMTLDWHDLFANPSHRVAVKPDSIVLTEYSVSYENPEPNPAARTALNAHKIETPTLAADRIDAAVVNAANANADTIRAYSVVTTPKWRVPDYVFNPGYPRRSLAEIDSFVRVNRHLPDIPGAGEIEDGGLDLAEISLRLLKNVEELTLHVIDLDKKNARLAGEVEALRARETGGRP